MTMVWTWRSGATCHKASGSAHTISSPSKGSWISRISRRRKLAWHLGVTCPRAVSLRRDFAVSGGLPTLHQISPAVLAHVRVPAMASHRPHSADAASLTKYHLPRSGAHLSCFGGSCVVLRPRSQARGFFWLPDRRRPRLALADARGRHQFGSRNRDLGGRSHLSWLSLADDAAGRRGCDCDGVDFRHSAARVQHDQLARVWKVRRARCEGSKLSECIESTQ